MTLLNESWWREGQRVALVVGGARHEVFVRVHEHTCHRVTGSPTALQSPRTGDAPWLTLLHGFPSSSWDFHALWPLLASERRLLCLDFLGYGASDKPEAVPYSTSLHADTLCALWSALGIKRTELLAHDIGTAVAQELLARRALAPLPCAIEGAVLMNGAVFIDRYRPTLMQRALMHPRLGPLLSSSMTKRPFARGLRRAFGAHSQPHPDDLAVFWRAMSERAGHRQLHRLLHHIPERVRERERWEGALRTSDVPLAFVWGVHDPFVGFVAEDIRRHLPHAPLYELAVGHFPQLEAPEAVCRAVLRLGR